MKKILVILFILINFNVVCASEYKKKVFGLTKPDKWLACDHEETLKFFVWEFREIKDEILGDFTVVRPLGELDKNYKPVKDTSKGTSTVLDKKHIPTATRWVQLFYDKDNLSIKSIALFGFLNKDVRDDGFRLITIVYEFNDSDKDFLNNTSQKIKEARSSFPDYPAMANDIDARDHLIKILGITKVSLQKQNEMDYDKSYKRKRSTYICYYL